MNPIHNLHLFLYLHLLYSKVTSSPKFSKRFALENHPSGKICTLYVHLMSTKSTDFETWESVILSNKDRTILSLSNQGEEIVPTVTFLEQCTINILVSSHTSVRFKNFVLFNIHTVRSTLHSTFIVIWTNGCNHPPFSKPPRWNRPVFYHFTSCNRLFSNEIFPNGILDFFANNSVQTWALPLTIEQPFSIFDSRISMSDLDNVPPYSLRWEGWLRARPKRECANYREKLSYRCQRVELLLGTLEKLYNFTTGRSLKTSVGISGRNMHDDESLMIFSYMASNGMFPFDDFHNKLLYCVSKQNNFIDKLKSLVYPLHHMNWIATILAFFSLIMLPVFSRNFQNSSFVDRVMFLLQILLEQGFNNKQWTGVIVCFSFLIISTLYKSGLTTLLTLNHPPSPYSDFNELYKSGYSISLDPDTYKFKKQMILKTKAKIFENRTFVSKIPYIFASYASASELYSKVLRPVDTELYKVKKTLEFLDYLLQNVTCFYTEDYGQGWVNFVFYGLLNEKLMRACSVFRESGIWNFWVAIGDVRFRMITYYPELVKIHHKDEFKRSLISRFDANACFFVWAVCLSVSVFAYCVVEKYAFRKICYAPKQDTLVHQFLK